MSSSEFGLQSLGIYLGTITQESANCHYVHTIYHMCMVVYTSDPPAISRPKGIFTAVKMLELGNTCADAVGLHCCLGRFWRWHRDSERRNTAVSPPIVLVCHPGRDRRCCWLQQPAVASGRLYCRSLLPKPDEAIAQHLDEEAKQELWQPACIMNVYSGNTKPRWHEVTT